jgi:flagellar secretion chaperone FliS
MRSSKYADNQYVRSQYLTASPGRLLVMTFDGILRFLHTAKPALEHKRFEEQHQNIVKAQNLVMELICSLNHSVNPALAENLDRLYRYSYDLLTKANIEDDLAALLEAEKVLSGLREAWIEAEAKCVRGEEDEVSLSRAENSTAAFRAL